MATQSKVQSETRPQWAGHPSAPVVSASLVINVRSDRSEESLRRRIEEIKQFVEAV
jgi:hypothetical protein